MRYAISDIHGCYRTFNALLDTLKLTKEDTLYILGDFVDRGPHSKEVLDKIILLKEEGYSIECIKGNHDDWFLEYLTTEMESRYFGNWLLNGGDSTLRSFKAESSEDIDPKYTDFLKSLPTHIELDDYVLVHGGLNLYLKDPINGTTDGDKMWERCYGVESFEGGKWPLGDKKLVVGHTIRTSDQIRKYVEYAHVYMIDNGCVFNHLRNKGYGNLAYLNLDTKEVKFQNNIEIY